MTDAWSDWQEGRHFRVDAVKGSRKLLEAIHKAQGIFVAKPKRKRKPRTYRPQVIYGAHYPPNPRVTPIQIAVADFYGIDADHLWINRRSRWCAKPRQVVMFLAHQRGVSLPQIGRHFGKDHTTVLHACRAVAANGQLSADAQAIALGLENIGDKSPNVKHLPVRNSQEWSKEHSRNTQEERLAA